MSVRLKLVVIVLFVALVPLVVSAFTALGIHRRAFDGKVAELHRATADSAALVARELIANSARGVGAAAKSIPWASASESERDGALWLLYNQVDEIAVAALFDERQSSVARSAFVMEDTDDPAFDKHPKASIQLLQRFYQYVPFERARKGLAIGEVFPGEAGEPLLPLAIPVPGANDKTWVAAVAVSLRPLCGSLERVRAENMELFVIDDSGRIVCGRGDDEVLSTVSAELLRHLPKADGGLVTYEEPARGDITAAVSPVAIPAAPGGRAWSVVAQQPRQLITAVSERMRLQTLFWVVVSIVAALGAGLFLARGISTPVKRLVRGARALAGGNFAHRVEIDGRDEFAGLADAFNSMSEEIEQRNAEIEAFNVELQERVERRTTELKAAQAQLLQSQKIAAVSSLAAGVAHEINNPLTGVLGLTQVLKLRAGDGADGQKRRDSLERIETEAKRIRDIVQTMLTLSEEGGSAGEGFELVDLSDVVRQAMTLVESRIAPRGIELELTCGDVPPVYGNFLQLKQVVVHLVNNALTAMSDGGKLSISVGSVEGELVRLIVSDTGSGIPQDVVDRVFEPFFTTKEEWEGRGLGLAVSYRIVQVHNGKIELASEVGKGTTVVTTLPAGRGGAHLV